MKESKTIILNNLILYGDVHINPKGKKEIENLFNKYRDIDCVAMELPKDKTKKPTNNKLTHILRYIFTISNYGSAMICAGTLATKNNIKIEYIDTAPRPKLFKNGFIKEYKKTVKQREVAMAKNIIELSKNHKKILVIIGKMHLEPIVKRLE